MEAPNAGTAAATSRRVQRAWSLLLLALACWLAAAAWLVDVEYGDGYSTVANAEYLLGSSGSWFWQRGPMLALLLVPAEWLAQWWQLAPLDVRAHHATMALLHLGYLAGSWILLRRRYGATPASLLAWVAAIPTVVFFSYAPFISHDIAPGLLVLGLLWLAHAHARRPTLSGATQFALVCAALVLVKQTYALAPVAVLLARLLALISLRRLDAAQWRSGLSLAAAAAVAGAACWLTYGALAAARFPEVSMLLRPLAIIDAIGNNYEGLTDLTRLFDRWMYLRNLDAYGAVAAVAALPGLVLAWRSGEVWSRQLALAWLLLLAALCATPYKEVRYLAFLAPLTACLVVPAIALALARGRTLAGLVAVVVLLDFARALPEAARIADPWYRDGVTRFYEPLREDAAGSAPIFFGIGWLSFLAPDARAFPGDPLHRITEMQIEQIRVLYGLPRERMFRLPLVRLAQAAQVPGGVFLVQNHMLSRVAPFSRDSRVGLAADFQQFYARATDVGFRWNGAAYVREDACAYPLLLVRADVAGSETARVAGEPVAAALLQRFGGFEGAPARVRLRALQVLRECDLQGCRRTGP